MKKAESRHAFLRGILITAAAFIAMVLVLVFSLSQVDERNQSEQVKALEDAVMRATLTCYAVEGRYPTSVNYLKENYGIVYNDNQFIVTLDSFASNLLPDIQVLIQGGGMYEE